MKTACLLDRLGNMIKGYNCIQNFPLGVISSDMLRYKIFEYGYNSNALVKYFIQEDSENVV